MPIKIRAEYRILLNTQEPASVGEGTFTVPVFGGIPVRIVRAGDHHDLVVEASNLDLSQPLVSWLQKGQPKLLASWPDNLSSEIDHLHEQLTNAASVPVGMCKYFLGYSEISNDLVTLGRVEWAIDQSNWSHFPFKATMSGSMSSHIPLTAPVVSMVQDGINDGVRPFLAIRHLHRAIAESIPRFKWIEATIAAELAIKEALIIAKPELATLLLEMPSPPLSKLYGSIMKEHLGRESDFRTQIVKGVEIRNRLMHRPQDEEIPPDKASEYVATVERAVFQLLSLVYPNSKIIGTAGQVVRHT